MRVTILAAFIGLAGWMVSVTSWAQTTANAANPTASKTTTTAPPVQSGIYGFSGAKIPYGDPEGVIGECVWIFDADNKHQVAKGDCYENNPGKFRVVLKPGRYVVRGPGGNKSVEVKSGGWVKVESIVLLPMAP